MGRVIEKLFILYAWGCGALLFGSVGCIVGYLFYMGASNLSLSLIFGTENPLSVIFLQKPAFNGLFPAIFGTFVLVLFSVGIALPTGISTGIYLAEYAGKKTKHAFGFFFDILAGIPSIVIGLFGFSITVFLHHYFTPDIYPCLLVSSLSLSFLVLPYLIRTTQTALESIPWETRQTALAIGASRFQNIFFVLIPHSFSEIMSGIVLSIGRCAEDTAVIMLTGVVASAGIPGSIMEGYEALPFYIYYVSSQYANAEELGNGFSAAIILIVICISLYVFSFLIKQKLTNKVLYRF